MDDHDGKKADEYDKRAKLVESILDMHVKLPLALWLVCLCAKYHRYMLIDWHTTTGLATIGTMVLGYYAIGGTTICAGFVASLTTTKAIGQMHALSLLVLLSMLHFAVVNIADQRRQYLNGLGHLCALLVLYVLGFQKLMMKRLTESKLDPTQLGILKFFGGALLAAIIRRLLFSYFHPHGVCELPMLEPIHNITYQTPDKCFPQAVLKVGESCKVMCRLGYSNNAVTNPYKCKAGWFHRSTCAEQSFHCVRALDGSDVFTEPNLRCPYHQGNPDPDSVQGIADILN